MGRLILVVALGLSSSIALGQAIPQAHLDAIREYHTKQIFGSSEDLTLKQPDVVLYRQIFERRENTVDYQQMPELDPIPLAQVFKKTDLKLGQLMRVAALASGYDAEFHPQVNQNEIVKINSYPNSLDDIAEYVTRVTGSHISIWPESRVVVVMPKGEMQ